MSYNSIVVFEDHGGDWLDLFDLLLKRIYSPLISLYAERAAQVLRQEIVLDPKLSADGRWNFTTLQDLRHQIREEQNKWPLALQSAVTCLSQIGLYLDHIQTHGAQDQQYRYLHLGFGIGTFAGAVASISRGTQDVLSLSPYAIVLSFRVGLLAVRKLDSLFGHRRESGNSTWASACLVSPDMVITDTLEEFNSDKVGVPHRQLHITSASESHLIISGPFTAVKSFMREHRPNAVVTPSLPFRVPSMYSESDFTTLSQITESLPTTQVSPNSFKYLSTSTGDMLQFDSASELLQSVVRECLTVPRNLTKACTTIVQSVAGHDCTIFALRKSQLAQHIQAQIQTESKNVNVTSEGLVPQKPETLQGPDKKAIAIVGMAGRFPGANDAEELWTLLQSGRDVHQTVPGDRFDFETHYDLTGTRKNTSKTPWGCFIDQPGMFDARFFNMSPKEAMQTDPAQRLMILTAYEALEVAGFVADSTPSTRSDRVGTFYGQASDDWREVNSSQNIDTYFIPGGIRAFGPGRINYHLKLSGPSFSIDTACSSSFGAIHAACNSLWLKDCDTALAGGANIITNPDISAGLSRGHFLSPTGSCKTFDATADGYCRADGVGSVVLKRLEDAELDNDNILGVISGVGTNHSAQAISITHPHAPTQAALYQSLLNKSGTDAHDIDYVEMHGTGTAAGDYNEMTSVSDVFASRHRPRRGRPLFIGSVKANVGHAGAAAGITSLIKTLQMLRFNEIPPHVGVKGQVNPAFPQDLEDRQVFIPFNAQSWSPRTDGSPRKAFLNNFSAAGGNTSLILEEYIRPSPQRISKPQQSYLLTLSAKSIRSMQMNIERLAKFISINPEIDLGDLSYTLNARRIAHNFRKSFVVSSLSQTESMLNKNIHEQLTPAPTKPPGTVFTFTGQGSLYTSIAKDLYFTCLPFQHNVQEYDRMAQAYGFPAFLGLLDGSLMDMATAQPTILQVGQACIQLALARLWISWGVRPKAVIGHSLGEYPALAIAGVLSEADMIYLVGLRAQLLEKNCVPYSHEMIAVHVAAQDMEEDLAGSHIDISCNNGPGSIVLGGPTCALEPIMETLKNGNIWHTKLSLPYAYHTAQVDPILNGFRAKANQVTFCKPEIPVLSPLLGQVVDANSEGVFDAEYLCRQARECVNFNMVLSSLKGQPEWIEKSVWLEIGPHPTCVKFAQSTLGEETEVLHSLRRKSNSWMTVQETVGALYEKGLSIKWQELYRGTGSTYRLVNLPSYAWDLKRFWIDYANDWCLTKGSILSQPDQRQIQIAPRFYTTSVQRIIQESIKCDAISLVTESHFNDPLLLAKAQGHKVNGTTLCPSSLYAEIAFGIARYVQEHLELGQGNVAVDVRSMSVEKPFIVHEGATLRVDASGTSNVLSLQLSSTDHQDRSRAKTHATCEVRYGDGAAWLEKWQRTSYLVKERISALEKAASTGRAHRIQKNLVYRLFSNFVDYSPDYQGIEEMILDSPNLEATARVYFKAQENGAVFDVPPTWIDSLAHITGVILNASDAVDHKSYVYISHGWKSMRFASVLRHGVIYRTYTKMQETENAIMEGDVWIMDEDGHVTGLVKGIKFQRVARRVIDVLLPGPSSQPAHALNKVVEAEKQVLQKVLSAKPQLSENSLAVQNAIITTHQASAVDETFVIIAEECGVDLSELVDGCTLQSLGIDSLLSLEILSRLRESLALDLAPHAFYENETIGDLRKQLQTLIGVTAVSSVTKAVGSKLTKAATSSVASTSYDGTTFTAQTSERDYGSSSTSTHSHETRVVSTSSSLRATSYLLSGNSKAASKFLFLFPDGSGSATSYATLPPFAHDTCVFAMNCPFMKQPELWNNGISLVVKLFLEEMRLRQPRGPYNVAGWSAGGILAYEAALQLQAEGETVDRLMLVDSPCPVNLPPMPVKMFQFLDSVGLLGSGNAMGTPTWLIPHFEAMVRNLDSYTPTAFPPGHAPTTTTIWARRGVISKTGGRRPLREQDDPAIMDWLLEDRTEFGSNGWETLIPRESIRAEVMDGHHFSMTTEHVKELGRLIAMAML